MMKRKQKYIKPCIEVIKGASPGMILAGSIRANGEDWKKDKDDDYEDLSGQADSEVNDWKDGGREVVGGAKRYSMDSLTWKAVW